MSGWAKVPQKENENPKWESRIRRANELASSHAFASEGMRFYERIARLHRSLYSEMRRESGVRNDKRPSGTLRQEFDLFMLLPRFAPFLSALEEFAPPPIARAARELRLQGSGQWQEILQIFWEGRSEKLQPAEELLSWIFLQPYAEYLADHSEWNSRSGTASICPLCGSKPQAAVLRPEGDGGKRSLVCSLCATEWDYGRIACAGCGEEDPHKLAVYVTDDFAYMRVEACESCRQYIKAIDLTKNGRAVPIVDELAIIPLDLWAREHGYEKIRLNLLGI